MERKFYFDIILKLPVTDFFIYHSSKPLTLYTRVLVPFRARELVGFVYQSTKEPKDFVTKSIIDVLDTEPIITDWQIKLAQWMSQYYLCSMGEAFSCMLPFSKLIRQKTNHKSEIDGNQFIKKLDFELTEEQNQVYLGILQSYKNINLLHGITGSGKTQIYIKLIFDYLKNNKQVIFLLPEISMTPQVIENLLCYFSERETAVIHSKISSNEKYKIYRLISKGEKKLIIGTRSSLFAPFNNLGLIIIDEEHDNSYKNNKTPRYHIRHISQKMSHFLDLKVVLGSATPCLETYYSAKQEKVMYFFLENRFYNVPLPASKILTTTKDLVHEIIIQRLICLISNKKQALIYLNRRGYSRILKCALCNAVEVCPRCNIPLVFHKIENYLKCHYCLYDKRFSKHCRSCDSGLLIEDGLGVEKIFEYLREKIPSLKIGLLDSDNVKTLKDLKKILLNFKNHKLDVLLGTQILSKGHDFKRVDEVFLINPENALTIPDFRSTERAFSSVVQFAGRSGRRHVQGKIWVQTQMPDNMILKLAMKQDYNQFAQSELITRKELNYPPFLKMARVVIRSKKEIKTKNYSKAIFEKIKDIIVKNHLEKEIVIHLPQPCVLKKIKYYYRWNIIFKIKNPSVLNLVFKKARQQIKMDQEVYLEYDIDVEDMF